jgi:hypothetical protein
LIEGRERATLAALEPNVTARYPTPGDGANAPRKSGPMICWRTASSPM